MKSAKLETFQIARQLGIKQEMRYLRKEIEIVAFIEEFLTSSRISFEIQKSVGQYISTYTNIYVSNGNRWEWTFR